MKSITTFCIAALMLFVCNNIRGQEDWEPQFFTTGYLVTQFEFADIDNFNDRDKYALGLSEAAFSASYLPLEDLEIKGTFLYRPGYESINKSIVEAYATWAFSDQLKIGLGRYLTPLSPTNNYFYAPLNNSATLPILINHHMLFPESFDGIKISGEIGTNNKLGYTGIVGQYLSLGHTPNDLLGFQGIEEYVASIGQVEVPEAKYPLGFAVRMYGDFNDVLKIGGNYFFGYGEVLNRDDATGIITTLDAERSTLGADIQLSLGNFNFKGEYWYGEKNVDREEEPVVYEHGYYTEASYAIGSFTPFLKYENLKDFQHAEINKFTTGITYRPIYQTLFKLEYGRYAFDYSDELSTKFPDLTFQENINHFILSTVISF